MRVLSPIEALEQGIIAAESGGNPNALHPLVKSGRYAGERAIGLYGIMPGNVPNWSREHLGREITPAELAQDTEAQRRIFQGEMQKNLAKHGTPQDAASVWFTGRPYAQAARAGANDSLTSVQDYVAKVTGSAPAAPPTAAPAQAAPATGSPTMPMGGLGGLGGYQPPTGMQTFGDILQALGMSMLSSPNNNMFQGVPTMMTAIQGRRGKEADAAKEAQRWNAEFGLKSQDLEARRAEQAIDNARADRQLLATEAQAKRSGLGTVGTLMAVNHPELDPTKESDRPRYMELYKQYQQAGGTEEIFGTTPQRGYDKDGNIVEYVIGNRGTVKPITAGEGVSPSPKGRQVKTATEVLTYDPAGNIIARQPLNREEGAAAEARGREMGKAEGVAAIDAPKRLENITKALGELSAIEKHPSREATTGWQANLGLDKWAGSPQQGFRSRVDQATAGAFLEGAQALKGLGQMTEVEGAKATAAINRMNIAQGDEEFMSALNDYRDALLSAEKKIQAANRGGAKAPPPGYRNPVPGAGNRVRYDANGNRM